MIYKGCGYEKSLLKNHLLKMKLGELKRKLLRNNQKFTKLYKEK